MINRELEMEELTEYFLADSKVVLWYIANDSRAFKTFVANRMQTIQENSSTNQRSYILSEDNPADDASRGMAFKNSLPSLGGFKVQHFYRTTTNLGEVFIPRSKSKWQILYRMEEADKI